MALGPSGNGSEQIPQELVQGTVARGFQPVQDAFEHLGASEWDVDGQFVAYHDGTQVVDLWVGDEVQPDDLQGVFSSTKGVSASCLALLAEWGLLDLDEKVARYWPEFGGSGKAEVTIRMVLSHQAGIPGVEPQLSLDQLIDHDYAAGRLAAQYPHWLPGKAHGYHGTTIGTVMDELVRRIDGRSISQFFREEIGEPRGIDFFITTSVREEPRVRRVRPKIIPGIEPARPSPDSVTGLAFHEAAGWRDLGTTILPNVARVRQKGQAASSGVGSARGLARLYAMLISEVDGIPRLVSSSTIERFAQIQTVGEDLVLQRPTRYGIVYQKADDRLRYGSHQAFGHDGAGGSFGVADSWHGVAYAWIPRRMVHPGGADDRGLFMAATVRSCARELERK
jgi:CubicO group peptidase (beta-lactamase class C family)